MIMTQKLSLHLRTSGPLRLNKLRRQSGVSKDRNDLAAAAATVKPLSMRPCQKQHDCDCVKQLRNVRDVTRRQVGEGSQKAATTTTTTVRRSFLQIRSPPGVTHARQALGPLPLLVTPTLKRDPSNTLLQMMESSRLRRRRWPPRSQRAGQVFGDPFRFSVNGLKAATTWQRRLSS